MSKIETNTVCEIVKKNVQEPATVRAIIEEINLAVQPEPGEEEKPHVKKQYVVLVSDPDGHLKDLHHFVAWVLQIPEDESVATTQERIFRGSYDYNASRKGRLYPVNTVGEALENVPARFFAEAEVWAKTRIPVLLIRSDNAIPKAEGDK